jgi:hypothetical protein
MDKLVALFRRVATAAAPCRTPSAARIRSTAARRTPPAMLRPELADQNWLEQ